jgi:4-alpha-glucanotransferase
VLFSQGNWAWRYHPDTLTWELQDRLKTLTEMYGRRVYPEYKPSESNEDD